MILRPDYRGTMQVSAFYRLEALWPFACRGPFVCEQLNLRLEHTFVVQPPAGELAEFALHSVDDIALLDCEDDHRHIATYVFLRTPVTVSVVGGKVIAPMTRLDRMIWNSRWLLAEPVAAALSDRRLRGVELLPVEVKENLPGLPGAERMRYWQTKGRSCDRPWLVDGGPNLCPHCLLTPVVCPTCGDLPGFCLECHKETWTAYPRKTPDDMRIRIVPLPERRVDVVDGSRWDGGDTFNLRGDMVVSRRVLEILLSVHAGPFAAEPIAVWTDKMTAEQKERLDEVSRPLRD